MKSLCGMKTCSDKRHLSWLGGRAGDLDLVMGCVLLSLASPAWFGKRGGVSGRKPRPEKHGEVHMESNWSLQLWVIKPYCWGGEEEGGRLIV